MPTDRPEPTPGIRHRIDGYLIELHGRPLDSTFRRTRLGAIRHLIAVDGYESWSEAEAAGHRLVRAQIAVMGPVEARLGAGRRRRRRPDDGGS